MQADPGIRSYPDIGDKAFGTRGRLLISVFMNLELYLVATGFLIMAGDNLHNLLPNVNFEIHGLAIGGHRTFVLLVALVVMPTVWINNMTTLSYVSATGVVASVLILVSILWSGISDIGFHHKGELLNWSGLPTAFSLYAFCYCAHPVFPTLYNSMRNQRQFSSVTFDFLKTLYLHLIQQQKSLDFSSSSSFSAGSAPLFCVVYIHLRINGDTRIPNVRFGIKIPDNIEPLDRQTEL